MREIETTQQDIVYEDQHMIVSLITDKPSERIVSQLPDIKCYREEPKKGRHSFYQSVLPILVLEPKVKKYENELYDFSAQVHLSHGYNFANESNKGITGLDFRTQRPDLAHFFDLDIVQSFTEDVPVLGFHFGLDEIEDLYEELLDIFTRLVEVEITDSTTVTLLSFKIYFDHSALEDTEVNRSRATILPVVFRDELIQHAGMLVNELASALTLEIQEQRHLRSRVIASIVNKWLSASSTSRVAQRLTDRPEQYMFMLSYVLTAWFEDRLEQAIYQVIAQK